jgi:hypothetical protein
MSFLYEVRVRGRLSRTLASEFEQLALATSVEPVETVLSGPVEDQAALHGLLRRIESLGLELLEVRRFPSVPPTTDAGPAGVEAGAEAPDSGH